MKPDTSRFCRHGRRPTIFVCLLLALFVFSVAAVPAPVAAAVLSKDYELDWVYEYAIDGSVGDTVAVRMFLDGEIVFCLQPHVGNQTGDVYGPPVPAEQFYAPDVLERIGLIAHYGYHTGDGSLRSAAFSTMMIHETVGYPIRAVHDFTGDGVFTGEAYDAFCAQTEAAIGRYNTLPSFAGGQVVVDSGLSARLLDENGVLGGYRVVEAPAGITVSIEGDELLLAAEPTAAGGTVRLERMLSNVGVPLLFLLEGRQHLVKALVEAPRRAEVHVDVAADGGFTIEKVSPQGQLIDGSRFEIRGEGVTRTVDVGGGRLEVGGLAPGTYDLRELAAPPGYRLDGQIRQVDVRPGQLPEAATVRVVNEPETASVEILKTDEQGRPTAGVGFVLSRRPDFSDQLLSGRSGEDGRIVFPDLPLYLGRTVYVRETDVPAHLALSHEVREIELADGQTHRIAFTNRFADSAVVVRKVDERAEPIEGARFELSHGRDFDGVVLEAKTDAAGTAVFSGLSVRDGERVFVRETFVPAPFLRDERVLDVVLKPGEEVELTFRNDFARASIRLQKRDALDGRPLEGAVFGLFLDEVKIAEAVTDAAGTAVFSDCLPGAYVVRELAAPSGYVLDAADYPAVLVYGGDTLPVADVVLEIDNRPILGRIRILKRGEPDGEPIAGAVFVIYDENGLEVERLTTDADGTAASAALRFGRYTVVEVEAPGAYYLGGDEQTVEIGEDDVTVDVRFSNEKIELVLRILKFDAETNQPLAGAVFALYDAAGSRLEIGEGEGDSLYQVRSGADGSAVTTLRLTSGRYTLVEVEPPPGYVRSVDQSFEVGRETPVVELTWYGRAVEQLVGNTSTVCEFVKTDLVSGECLTGALMLLHEAESGAVVDVWYSEAKPRRINRLVAGRAYTLSELLAPKGYVRGPDLSLTVAETDEVQTFQFENEPTAVLVEKKETGGSRPVVGASFRLYDAEMNTLAFEQIGGSWRPSEAGQAAVVTDGAGRLLLTHLPPGRYTLEEIGAPGCLKRSERRPFRLGGSHTYSRPLVLPIENEPFELKIRKTDASDASLLAGAVFQLRRAGGAIVAFTNDGSAYTPAAGDTDAASTLSELTVGADGMLRLLRLLPAAYELHELRAPRGYEPAAPLAFTVTGEEEERLVLTVPNEKRPTPFPVVALPVSGERPPSFWPVLGTLCLLNGAGLLSLRSLLRRRRGRRSRKTRPC